VCQRAVATVCCVEVVRPLSGIAVQCGLCPLPTTTTKDTSAPTTTCETTPVTTATPRIPPPTSVYVDGVSLGESLYSRFNSLGMMMQASSSFTGATQPVIIATGDSVAGILAAYINRVTIVDTFFPFTMAIKGHALSLGGVIQFFFSRAASVGSTPCGIARGEKRQRNPTGDGESASLLLTSGGKQSEKVDRGAASRAPLVLDLQNPLHRLDFTALSSSASSEQTLTSHWVCPCYTCMRHTAGYIYHLINVQEMNSTALLVIHNLTQVVGLCRALRKLASAVGGDAARRVAGEAMRTFCAV
jgi:hypothetical protein